MVKDDNAEVYLVETSAGKICCRETGAGEASLLLLHGSSFSKEVFEPLMRHPALAHIRTVAIDLPGHGQSENARDPSRTYRIAGFAHVVREVLVAGRLQPCVILGWSLGGDIAMEFIGENAMVRGLVLVGAPPVRPGILGKLRGYTLTGAKLAAKPKFTHAEAIRFERQCIGASSDGRFVDALMRTDRLMRPRLARSTIADCGRDQRKAFCSAATPVWLVAGAEDPLVRMSYLQKLAGRCAAKEEPWIVPEAGHAPFIDSPDAFAVRLADFVCAAFERGDRVPSHPGMQAAVASVG